MKGVGEKSTSKLLRVIQKVWFPSGSGASGGARVGQDRAVGERKAARVITRIVGKSVSLSAAAAAMAAVRFPDAAAAT